jgi:hypothetical protein
MRRLIITAALVLIALFGVTMTADAAYREVPVPRAAQRLGVTAIHMDFPSMRATLVASLDTDPSAACEASHSGAPWSWYPATPDSDVLLINCAAP